MVAMYLVEWSYTNKPSGLLSAGTKLFKTSSEAYAAMNDKRTILYDMLCIDLVDGFSISMREVFMNDQDQKD